MLNIKSTHTLYSVILLFCMSHALAKLGITSGSSASVSLGLGQDVALGRGLGRYLDPSTNKDLGLGLVTITKRETKPGGLSEALESSKPPSVSEDTLRTADLGRGVTSELSDLFAVGSSNASIPLNSKVKLVELEGGSSAKTDQIKANVPGAFNLSLNGSKTDLMPKASDGSQSPQQANANKSLIVPSEGGVLEEGLSQISPSKSSLMAVSSTTTVKTEVKDTKEDVSMGQPTREGVSSLVKPVKSEDAHISARKGANLFEQTESENSNIDSTMGPLTYTSSEISLDSLSRRTQKISPRKGAELPKIFPRKGVDEQFVNLNSSDQFLSDITSNKNNTTGSILSVSVSSPTISPTYSSEPADNPNPTGVVKHINTSKTLQNSSMTFMTEKTIPPLVSPNSENSITGASNSPSSGTTEAVTSKTEPIINGSSTKSNSTSSTIGVKNSTLDKSGIVASYPPLKRRPKPLITTYIDLNSASRPPITTEHNSGERDYVIPIVVTILTVPMLVVLMLFLYKKGSEFWERRHYRRMDFLIDGMYND